MRHLPPLAAVRVFEAAARHANFTVAAAELGMTQAAVSYQVKLLEERLGVALFRRDKRRVVLTEPGRRAATRLSAALDAIDATFAELRQEDEAVLTVSTSTTFANAWLAWRLGAFQTTHASMAVRMLTGDALTDFAAEPVDCAIRTGLGPWPGLVQEPLLPIAFTPMASPAFLARHGGAIAPADLPAVQLIGREDEWWSIWLRAAGVPLPQRQSRPGVRLDSQANEGHAALAGQGVAMLTPFFWRNDLAKGELVRLSDVVAADGASYWLVYPEHRRHVVKLRRFRDWLMAEVARDRAALGAGNLGGT